jgi:hypothetical protein
MHRRSRVVDLWNSRWLSPFLSFFSFPSFSFIFFFFIMSTGVIEATQQVVWSLQRWHTQTCVYPGLEKIIFTWNDHVWASGHSSFVAQVWSWVCLYRSFIFHVRSFIFFIPVRSRGVYKKRIPSENQTTLSLEYIFARWYTNQDIIIICK